MSINGFYSPILHLSRNPEAYLFIANKHTIERVGHGLALATKRCAFGLDRTALQSFLLHKL